MPRRTDGGFEGENYTISCRDALFLNMYVTWPNIHNFERLVKGSAEAD